MILSRIAFSLICLLLFASVSMAQNVPEFDVPDKDNVIINSRRDHLIVSNVSYPDSAEQELSFDAVSIDESILKVDSVSFHAGDKMALIWVREKGVPGSVNISLSASTSDTTITKEFEVEVIEYPHHGIKFEIHDAIFWQEVVPLNDTPIFDSIIPSTNMTAAYNDLIWNDIPLTVGAGCGNPTLCDGHDFSTGFLEGFLVPKKSGNYHFYMNGDAQYALFLSSNNTFNNAEVIAANSDNHGKIGTIEDGRKSAPISLDSGLVYAIYAVHWNVHHERGGIKWELPGEFGPEYIDGEFLYPLWDTQKPFQIENISVKSAGDSFLNISWNKSSDNQKLAGYNIYVNGERVNKKAVSTNNFLLEDLDASTVYSVSVTAVDHVNNESFINEIINVQTLEPDTIPPSPPTSLNVDEATGLALKISWDGANDGQSTILGYKIYMNGELVNTDSLITNQSYVLKVLDPETEYDIEIEAVDAGMNGSAKSQVFTVSTIEFDPLSDNVGLNTGKLEISAGAMSYNEGLGINPDYKSGKVFNAAHTELLDDLQPGAIRWGALTANPLSFSDYAGAGKDVTIGKFITRCNEFGAYTAFCCGVENSTDWRKNSDTFIRFLEYINGPDDTPGGQLRVAEGYSGPLLKNSPGIIFEFGNEVWGGNSHNAQIGKDYNAYAQWCREIARKMKASPYYDSSKIYLAYSSRYPSREHSYGLNEKIIKGDNGDLEWTAPSGYLGGNLDYDPAFPPADSELGYYENVRNRADSYLEGMMSSHKYEVEKTGRFMEQYMYESNTTTPTYNGRLGQALLSTDYYLSAMERGSAIPTIFHLTGGQWRITEPENDYRRLPLFLTAKYINKFCKGDVLYNTYHSNKEGTSEQGAIFSKRPVGAHTYRNGKGISVVLISRDYKEDHYVQIDLPEDFSVEGKGKNYSITGSGFSTKNAVVDSADIVIEDGMIVKVPKFAMVIVQFEIENPELENLPLAYYPYPGIEELEIPEGDYTFTGTSENKRFTAQITPSNSWDKKIIWSFLYNSGNYGILKKDTYCIVYSGSDLSNETDSMILRATNRIGDVSAEVVIYPQNSVGIDGLNKNNELIIYPNPANTFLNIESGIETSVLIYNITGSKVFEKELTTGLTRIDLTDLPGGIYTIQAGSKTERLIVR